MLMVVNVWNILMGICLYVVADTIEVRTFFRELSEKIKLTFGLENVPERIAILLFILTVLYTIYLSMSIFSQYMKIISHEKCGWDELPYLWWLPMLIVGLVTLSIVCCSIHISLAFTVSDCIHAIILTFGYVLFIAYWHDVLKKQSET